MLGRRALLIRGQHLHLFCGEYLIKSNFFRLALLREFYPEGLVDHATLLFWISQQIIGCNLAQCSFIVGLAEEYFDGLVQHRGFMTPFLEGCLQKLVEVTVCCRLDKLSH
jgi:hypothetical protein